MNDEFYWFVMGFLFMENNHKPTESWEKWRGERTRIIGEMIENPDHIGIFPTTKCFSELDVAAQNLLHSQREELCGRLEVIRDRVKRHDGEFTGLDEAIQAIKNND